MALPRNLIIFTTPLQRPPAVVASTTRTEIEATIVASPTSAKSAPFSAVSLEAPTHTLFKEFPDPVEAGQPTVSAIRSSILIGLFCFAQFIE